MTYGEKNWRIINYIHKERVVINRNEALITIVSIKSTIKKNGKVMNLFNICDICICKTFLKLSVAVTCADEESQSHS